MKLCEGIVQNGVVALPADCRLRNGQRVRIEAVEKRSKRTAPPKKLPRLDEHHPACGLWADRPEMADSVAYVRAVRARLGQRACHE